MYCWKCGSELPDNAAFCSQCGAATRPGKGQSGVSDNPASAAAQGTTPSATPGMASAPSYVAPQAGAPNVPPMPPYGTPPSSMPTGPAGVPGMAQKRSKTPFIVAGVCVLAALVVVACLLTFNLVAKKSATTTASSAVEVNGATVEALARPTIATVTVDATSGIPAAPALAGYQTSGDTTSNSSSSDGSDGSATGDSNGNASGSGTGGTNGTTSGNAGGGSSGSASGGTASGTSGSGNVAIKNNYGTLAELKPTSGLANVTNASDFRLSSAQKSLLEQNMFAIDPSDSNSEFFDIYEMNRYSMLASFVTTDSIMHSYHLYFSHLLKNCEKQYLSNDLLAVSKAMLQTSSDQLNTLTGSEWEGAAQRNVTFFAVACRLLDSSAEIPASVESTVNDEVSKIQSASAQSTCAITGDPEDYSQYKPRGYYEGDEQLERYFRAMMWYGRINFTQTSTTLNDDLDRSALLITLALDGGTGGTVNADWESIYTVTSFFAGASDDMTYYEYLPLFLSSYGEGTTVASLAGNTQAWETYHGATAKMPAPKISSVIVGDEAQSTADDIKGFRFMGQRFSIDESVFQQLVYDNVGTASNPRTMPSGLDLPAALGSDEALGILTESGETSYENYDSQMQAVRTSLANSDDDIWSASVYSQWLYTLNPLLASKGEGYPTFMQSSAWDRKNLQSYMGSYTELKHDTVLYSKQVMVEMGGGSIPQNDDRGYVEPEPDLYGRLANLTQATSDGLTRYGMLSSDDASNLKILQDLATQLKTISEKELAGESLSDDEYELIRTYGGQLEHFWQMVNTTGKRSSEFPAAVVVDVATDNTDGKVLELGTGMVSSIYVLVPIDGQLHLCKGAVFSYYEFEQPQSNRLTDSSWREMLGITGSHKQSSSLPSQPGWTQTLDAE